MALTDRCDIFASMSEDTANGIIRLIQRQRPALFNYGTAAFARGRKRWCHPIEADPRVERANNPLITVQPPIPVIGAPLPIGLNWLLQLTDLQVDFHPNDVIALPPELGRLSEQRFALRMKACFTLDCPGEAFMREQLPRVEELAVSLRGLDDIVSESTGNKPRNGDREPPAAVPTDPIVPPLAREGQCFCLELFAVLHFEWGTIGTTVPPKPWLKLRLDGLEIDDLSPKPMEDMVECYISAVLRLSVLPRLALPIEALVLDIASEMHRLGLPLAQRVRLEPAPVPIGVPNNPAVENDELRAFVNLVVEPA
ncbi:MAG TPA: hypothetical protein PLU79_01940 [Burkholderiaceae bacterium]|nr:hypothetical protein [Burkholderiaceae bacterium]